ncbi:MAG: DNA translocase FtsK [Clostridiales bacterium]|nr:DNA translocase FtsK [Clostridiales bacterium]
MDKKDFQQVPFPASNNFFFLRLGIFVVYILLSFYFAVILEEKFAQFGFLQIICYVWFILCMLFVPKLWRFLFPKKTENKDIRKLLQYFISANKLYETETIEVIGRDGKTRKDSHCSNYAKFGYWESETELIIRAYKLADKFSDKMNNFDTLLQALIGLPLNDKNDTIIYCDYHFKKQADERLFVSSNNGNLEYNSSTVIPLNNNLSWRIDKQPHALIAGVTGGGKTTFIFYLLIELLKMKSMLYVCDPKKSDLGSLKHILGEEFVATESNQISRVIRQAKEEMDCRYRTYKDNPDNFRFGASFKDYGLSPLFVIFDEMGAFRAGADKKVYAETMANLTEIILKGREMGVFVLLSTQQPNANNIPTELRDNLSLRIALGNMGNEGYRMVFGESNANIQSIVSVGGAYIYLDGLGWDSPKPFEAPFVDYNNFDFIAEIKKYVGSN